jgi:integrase
LNIDCEYFEVSYPLLQAYTGLRSTLGTLGIILYIDRVGSLWRENSLIFASEVGEPLDRRYITTHRFKPLIKREGLPEKCSHDLRHTCATLLLSKNVNPKIVSEMLGHATIAITRDTYSHVLPTMQESAAAAMEDALS